MTERGRRKTMSHDRLTHEQIERLVVQANEGSQQAFAQLYEAYLPQIYFYARKRLHDDDEATEVAQDTFLAAFMKLDRLRNPHAFHSWLYSIAGTYVAGAQRRANTKLNNEQSLDDLTDRIQETVEAESVDPPPLFEALASTDASTAPEQALETKEDRLALISAIDALSDAQKEAILLRYFAGLSVSEIAVAVGLSQSATLKRLHDARAHLRRSATTVATLASADDDPALTTALHESESSMRIEARAGIGAQVTMGIASALPIMLTGSDRSAAMAARARARARAFTKLSYKTVTTSGARASFPVVKVVAGTLVPVLLAGGAVCAISRYTARGAQSAVPAQENPQAKGGNPRASGAKTSTASAAPAAQDASATVTPVPAPEPEPAPQLASTEKPAPAPAPAPTPAPTSVRPAITLPFSTLTYRVGTPVPASRILADSGATVQVTGNNKPPVKLAGYEGIDWSRAGSYLCYLQATDSAGLSARTKVLSIVLH